MSAIRNYFYTQFKEFSALEFPQKVCLIGSWVAASGASLLIGSSAVTLFSWGTGHEPDSLTKRSMFLGFGLLSGGVMFTTGAALEDDKQSELSAEKVWEEVARRRALKEANNCTDFKSKEN